jgi:hypothetical protein
VAARQFPAWRSGGGGVWVGSGWEFLFFIFQTKKVKKTIRFRVLQTIVFLVIG